MINKDITLTFILCSRNDQYMGNSNWRLQTSLNYLAKNIAELELSDRIEIIISDWGSKTPLREIIKLSPQALKTVQFLEVPFKTTQKLQKESKFAEVFALNAAARRSKGEFIGRIDADTMVGKEFLRFFFCMVEQSNINGKALEECVFFSMRRRIPFRVANKCPHFWMVDRFLSDFGKNLKVERAREEKDLFYESAVGIFLLPRSVWWASRGYNESYIFMNLMEVEFLYRLMTKYKLIDLGEMVNNCFYHLEHYHPWRNRWHQSLVKRKNNPTPSKDQNQPLYVNDDNWGLIDHKFNFISANENNQIEIDGKPPVKLVFLIFIYPILIIFASFQHLIDRVIYFIAVWRKHFFVAINVIKTEPVKDWPEIFRKKIKKTKANMDSLGLL